ncbi:MAG: insulinase family protein, partial [Candidatus Hydrogenedentales bacterium]
IDEERYAYEMLSSVLGGGSTSRLFDRIREEEGLAYSIYAFNASYLNAGMLGVYAAIAPENFEKTLALCEEELRKLQDSLLDDEELRSNQEQLKGGLLLALENTFNRMARMARSVMYYDRVQTVEELLNAVDAVTAAELQGLAQQVFRPDRCLLAVVGPKPPQHVRVPAPSV